MRWPTKVRMRLRSLTRRRTVDGELQDELRFHLERQIAENVAAGMKREAAREAALREFGGLEQLKEECRDMRRANWLLDLLQDVRFGVRMLGKSPGFTLVAVATIALGIGANTAIFSMIDAVLLQTLPVGDPQSLVLVQWTAHEDAKHSSTSSYGDCEEQAEPNVTRCSMPEPIFNEFRSQKNLFSHLAAFAGADQLDLSGNGPASTVDNAKYVSGEYFETLGVRPQIGRFIGTADDSPSASPVVVLSNGYWKSQFGGSMDVLGKRIWLDRVPFTIIGVAEPRFDWLSPGNIIQMWLPLSSARQLSVPWDNRDADPNNFWLVLVGRLKADVTRSEAQAQLTTIFANEETRGAKAPWKASDAPSILAIPAQKGLTGEKQEVGELLAVLMMAVGIVLLISCANVAGLLLSRASGRQKEIAVRLALGAGRGRVVRQLLTENLLLSLAGGGMGVLLAAWLVAAITGFLTATAEGPAPFHPGIDTRVLLFTASVSLATGILFGLAPALRGIRVNVTPALKESYGNMPRRSARRRWVNLGSALVVGQVAMTIIVLAGAGLLVRTLENLKNVNPGFDTRNLLTFRIDPTLIGYKRADVDVLYQQIQGRLAAVPGVISASYSWRPLLGGGLWTTDFHLPGTPQDAEADADMLPVGMGFFHTMKIPLERGRELEEPDFATAQRVDSVQEEEEERIAESLKTGGKGVLEGNRAAAANLAPVPVIVNEAFVKKYFPKAPPIGSRFGESQATELNPRARPGWVIVGVVGDAKYNQLRREVQPTIYAPVSGQGVSFTLRTAVSPASLVPQIRSIVGQMDSNLPVYRIRTEEQQVDSQLMNERLIARLSSSFGLLALLLSCIGLYGLLAFEVAQRTREFGIRMALGARMGDVLRGVILQGLAMTAAGAVLGIGAALAVTKFMSSILYGVKPGDPITYGAVVALLVFVALVACWIPARRATRVDPMVALRYE